MSDLKCVSMKCENQKKGFAAEIAADLAIVHIWFQLMNVQGEELVIS